MSYSVLVVDDEDLTLRTVSRGLREEGFEVFTAASGGCAEDLRQRETRSHAPRHRAAWP